MNDVIRSTCLSKRWPFHVFAAALAFVAPAALAQPTPIETSSSAAAQPWSASSQATVGQPVLIHVIVALCSNEYTYCGSKAKGDPTDLDGNLYLGATFGARRLFDSSYSPWTRISANPASGQVLEHLIYQRPSEAFGTVMVSLEAWNGTHTDEAIDRFFSIASGGGQVTVQGRNVPIHAVGYVGLNRLLDGHNLPTASGGQAIPSFVIARASERTFGPALRQAGSFPLVTVHGTVAPEGYTILAAARAMADNYSPRGIRHRMIEEYARYQRTSQRAAAATFPWPHP